MTHRALKTTINQIIPNHEWVSSESTGRAPINIALIKYWGKRDPILNLPVTSSLSITLNAYSNTIIRCINDSHPSHDIIQLNGKILPYESAFARRTSEFLDYFRASKTERFYIQTDNDIATGAGLASSSSGMAALVLALNQLGGWNLSNHHLSILARIGSGSAARSLFGGFVIWNRGESADGMDSYAKSIAPAWTNLRLGVLEVNFTEKKVPSRLGMMHSQTTSPFYALWPNTVETDLGVVIECIQNQDFKGLGTVSESNAMAMHALTLSARPHWTYFEEATYHWLLKVHEMRMDGLNIYATLDAGPNVKIIFEEKDQDAITHYLGHVPIILTQI